MKKFISVLLLMTAILAIAGCLPDDSVSSSGSELQYPEYVLETTSRNGEYSPEIDGHEYLPIYSPDNGEYSISPSKIAIITLESSLTFNYHVADGWIAELARRHGEENLIIYSWPVRRHNFTPYETFDMINEIAANPEIGVLIINPAWSGTDHIVSILREQRDDIFVVYIDYTTHETGHPQLHDNTLSYATNVNLILEFDRNKQVRSFPAQARELGATTLVYFYDTMIWYFEEYVEWEESYWHGVIREKSAEAGLLFVEYDVYGAIQCGSSYSMFLGETIPLLIEAHGTDIVFFGVDNERLFWFWQNTGFIYLPMYPNWMGVTPEHIAWMLPVVDSDTREDADYLPCLIEMVRVTLEEKNMLGRIASFAIETSLLFPIAAAEYGVKWMNGEVPREGIDLCVLEQIMSEIIAEYTGTQLGVTLNAFAEDGLVYENYILVFPDYLVY